MLHEDNVEDMASAPQQELPHNDIFEIDQTVLR